MHLKYYALLLRSHEAVQVNRGDQYVGNDCVAVVVTTVCSM